MMAGAVKNKESREQYEKVLGGLLVATAVVSLAACSGGKES